MVIVDVIVFDPARGGERVDTSTGSIDYAERRAEWINTSPRSHAAGVIAVVRRT